MRFKRITAAVSVTALAVVGVAGIALADQSIPAIMLSQAKVTPATSTNWAGYVITRSGVNQASNAWFVPSVSTRTVGESAAFVGIDAATSGRVLEVGTTQNVSAAHVATYGAFYELSEGNNAPETPITALTVSPGDQVFGSLAQCANPACWTITLDDLTTGKSFTTTQAYSGFEATADYIMEAPTVAGQVAPLADFGTITFDGASINGGNSNLAASEEIDKVSPSNRHSVDATTGGPDADVNGFEVAYRSAR